MISNANDILRDINDPKEWREIPESEQVNILADRICGISRFGYIKMRLSLLFKQIITFANKVRQSKLQED
jgi:hypothetical protein